jgi:hypothetical protein
MAGRERMLERKPRRMVQFTLARKQAAFAPFNIVNGELQFRTLQNIVPGCQNKEPGYMIV